MKHLHLNPGPSAASQKLCESRGRRLKSAKYSSLSGANRPDWLRNTVGVIMPRLQCNQLKPKLLPYRLQLAAKHPACRLTTAGISRFIPVVKPLAPNIPRLPLPAGAKLRDYAAITVGDHLNLPARTVPIALQSAAESPDYWQSSPGETQVRNWLPARRLLLNPARQLT